MQALHYAEASSYSILTNRNFCDFTLWMSPALDVRRCHPFVSTFYTPLLTIRPSIGPSPWTVCYSIKEQERLNYFDCY